MTFPPPLIENSRLLKARDCRGLGAKEAFNHEDLRRRCEEYIAQTQQQARDLIDAARVDAEKQQQRVFDDAAERGRHVGLQNADAEIQQRATELAARMVDDKLRTVLPAMQAVGDSLAVERDRWIAQWESGVIRLCIAIAEKVIHRRLELNPEVGPEMVREALRLVTSGTHLRVRLNPHDKERMTEFTGDVSRSLGGLADVQLIAEEGIAPGGCLLETEHGQIDARLDTQLQRIFAELVGDETADEPNE